MSDNSTSSNQPQPSHQTQPVPQANVNQTSSQPAAPAFSTGQSGQPPIAVTKVIPPPSADMLNFYEVLKQMVKAGEKVSDLIFSPGRPPQVELGGDLEEVMVPGMCPLTAAITEKLANIMLDNNEHNIDTLNRTGSSDVSFSVPGLCRFRVNIFRQRGTHAIVMRVIPTTPPNWQDLNLPQGVQSVAELKNGLVLVTGPTGSGKSTTLAAVIDLINSTKKYHIVTVEDPIEFLHDHKKGTIHQRELHSDTPTFSMALRAALRQAPKVILVGEMRDRETIEVAMEAAETGHLVLSTLHTIDAAKTIDRILGVFPKIEEAAIRTRVAQSFRRIISQRLLPKAGGGRIAAIEILASTSRTRDYIEKGEGEGKSMIDAMKDGVMDGMQTFDGVIESFIREGKVIREIGLAYATNANNLKLAISDLPPGLVIPQAASAPPPVANIAGTFVPTTVGAGAASTGASIFTSTADDNIKQPTASNQPPGRFD